MTRLNRALSLATLFAAAVVLSSKADSSQGPACLHTPFHGITETSETGEVIGHVDPQDWKCAGESGARTLEGVPVPPPPSGVCMLPASPNPAAGAVRLRFTVGEARQVRLTMYGQTSKGGPRDTFPVRTLVDDQLVAGAHEVIWDAKDDAGQPLTPGIYRALLESGDDVLCGDIEIH